MLEIRNVTKSYGALTVLHNVSLVIPEGEIMAIVGPSGAGKTTLLQIAGTLDRPDSGSVFFDDTDLFSLKDKKLSEYRNLHIGFIFQFHQLLPEFSALENAAMPALIAGRKRKEAFAEARALLESLGLGHRLDHRPSELSGGEKQRTAIARALVNKPRVVFADEPTGSLDSRNRREIQDVIQNLCRDLGQTFVVVTHDREMASIADSIVEMADGRIVAGSAREPEAEMSVMPDVGLDM